MIFVVAGVLYLIVYRYVCANKERRAWEKAERESKRIYTIISSASDREKEAKRNEEIAAIRELKEPILKSLLPLIEKAKKEGLVIQCSHDLKLIFTPEELEYKNTHGEFIWGTINWKLVDPNLLSRDWRSNRTPF